MYVRKLFNPAGLISQFFSWQQKPKGCDTTRPLNEEKALISWGHIYNHLKDEAKVFVSLKLKVQKQSEQQKSN